MAEPAPDLPNLEGQGEVGGSDPVLLLYHEPTLVPSGSGIVMDESNWPWEEATEADNEYDHIFPDSDTFKLPNDPGSAEDDVITIHNEEGTQTATIPGSREGGEYVKIDWQAKRGC